MKFYISFKTPNTVEDAIKKSVGRYCTYDRDNCCDNGCDPCVRDLADQEEEDIAEEMQDTVNKFVAYGESITIEFDTTTKTAIVVGM